jgi:site-specific DNA-methyltransferase (adenine-specific)
MIKLTTIKSNPNNPRVIRDEKFKKLVKSIEEFPKMMALRPMVVNEEMVVLGGNMRLKALKELGYKEVPNDWVKSAKDLTEDEIRRFIIADNVGFGEHDWEMLANEWDIDELSEWGLDIPDMQMEEEVKIEAVEDDFEIPEEVTTDIVLGDLFEIGEHRLLCGSSTEIDTWSKLMGNKLADMVMTDPPYNVAYQGKTKDALTIENDSMGDTDFYQFLYDFYTALGSYTKKGGAWYVWHADSEGVNFRKAMKEAGILLKQCLIWVKNTMVMGRQDYHWKHEPCLYGWKEGAAHYFTDERTHTTVIEDKIDISKLTKDQMKSMLKEILSDKNKTTIINCDKPSRNDVHPTMKPILLLAPLIQNSSKEKELIADGFLGSGSTMLASHQLKRICYGMELDPKYCQVIVDRMRNFDPTLVIKKNGQII